MSSQDERAGHTDATGSHGGRHSDGTRETDIATPWWNPRRPKRSATVGAIAFLVGYVLTGVAFFIEMQSVSSDQSSSGNFVSTVIDQAVGIGGRQIVESSGGELALALRSVGWTFFSAHQIPLSGTASGLGTSASGRVDILSLAGRFQEIPLTTPLYYVLPPVCLVGAGWWLARSVHLDSPRAGFVSGAGLVAGYLPAVVVVTFLLGFSATVSAVVASATITAQPVVLRSLVFGAVYPVVFGGLGGVLAVTVRSG